MRMSERPCRCHPIPARTPVRQRAQPQGTPRGHSCVRPNSYTSGTDQFVARIPSSVVDSPALSYTLERFTTVSGTHLSKTTGVIDIETFDEFFQNQHKHSTDVYPHASALQLTVRCEFLVPVFWGLGTVVFRVVGTGLGRRGRLGCLLYSSSSIGAVALRMS